MFVLQVLLVLEHIYVLLIFPILAVFLSHWYSSYSKYSEYLGRQYSKYIPKYSEYCSVNNVLILQLIGITIVLKSPYDQRTVRVVHAE